VSLREKENSALFCEDQHKPVILSEVVVCEADDNAVEGPPSGSNLATASQGVFPVNPFLEMPFQVSGPADVNGVLRLRSCFASRSSHFAQDDKGLYIYDYGIMTIV